MQGRACAEGMVMSVSLLFATCSDIWHSRRTSSRMPWRDQPANGLDASQAEGSAVQQDRLALSGRRSPQRPPDAPVSCS